MNDQTRNACCAQCGVPLSAREEEICRSAPERFAGLLLCFGHQRRFSACPAVRGGLPR